MRLLAKSLSDLKPSGDGSAYVVATSSRPSRRYRPRLLEHHLERAATRGVVDRGPAPLSSTCRIHSAARAPRRAGRRPLPDGRQGHCERSQWIQLRGPTCGSMRLERFRQSRSAIAESTRQVPRAHSRDVRLEAHAPLSRWGSMSPPRVVFRSSARVPRMAFSYFRGRTALLPISRWRRRGLSRAVDSASHLPRRPRRRRAISRSESRQWCPLSRFIQPRSVQAMASAASRLNAPTKTVSLCSTSRSGSTRNP